MTRNISVLTADPTATAATHRSKRVTLHLPADNKRNTFSINLSRSHATPSSAPEDLELGSLCPPFRTFPAAQTKERFRDFKGWFTLHRLFVFSWIVLIGLLTHIGKDLFFPPLPGTPDYVNRWYGRPALSVMICVHFSFYLLVLLGGLMFKYNARLDEVRPVPYPVVWRIVSRGLNRECLLETIESVRDEMRKNPYFPYLIEIVTDGGVFQEALPEDVVHTQVPLNFKTENNTKFKARALHYACKHSVVPGHAWLVHLDEETRPSSSAIKGIALFIGRCERERNYKRIGQGSILYKRSWRKYPLLTLADMRRTGDDFGLFYVQNACGRAMFGLHGSYIVMRAGEESRVGFDIGPEGSITEDAWWVFLAMAQGYRLRWVDGFLEEQSTQSMGDFLKQRRRWMYGLRKVMFFNPAPIRHRAVFLIFMCKWLLFPLLIPLEITYFILLVRHNIGLSVFLRFAALFNMAMVTYSYYVGFVVNVREGMAVRRALLPFWCVAMLLLIPVFQLMEVVALVMSFFAGFSESGKGFHIVEKSVDKPEADIKS